MAMTELDLKKRSDSDIINQAVNELIMEEENNGFKRGELKDFILKLSEKYNVSWHSIKNRYYKEMKDKVKPNPKAKKRTAVASNKKKEKAKKVTNEKPTEIKLLKKTEQAVLEMQETKEVKEVKETKEVKEAPAKPALTLDEKIKLQSELPADKIYNFPKDHYRVGQLVEVKVANLQSYGAFCEINDGRGFQSLCHISEIVDGYIKRVGDYLEVGEIIPNAKVVLIDNKKINISFKHLNLKKKEEEVVVETATLPDNPPINVIGEKFGNLKDKLFQKVNENKTLTNDVNEVNEIFSQEGLNEVQEKIIEKYDKDIEQMTSYLQEQLGVLTPQAKLELAGIIDEQGVFNTTRGILKTQENFKADIGLLFMRQMKEKLGEYL